MINVIRKGSKTENQTPWRSNMQAYFVTTVKSWKNYDRLIINVKHDFEKKISTCKFYICIMLKSAKKW